VLCPLQTDKLGLGVIERVGRGLITTVTLAVPVHPFASVPVTV